MPFTGGAFVNLSGIGLLMKVSGTCSTKKLTVQVVIIQVNEEESIHI